MRTDKVSKTKRSEIMSLIKSSETKLEKSFRKELSGLGLRYRKNVANLMGKPDVAFIGKKLVIFIDSCFWHGCKRHFRVPKSNKLYWQLKIEKNKNRDKEVTKFYKKNGWIILRFWEHDLKNANKIIEKIRTILSKK